MFFAFEEYQYLSLDPTTEHDIESSFPPPHVFAEEKYVLYPRYNYFSAIWTVIRMALVA